MICPTCHTDRLANGAHIIRCATATPKERAFYLVHKHWPRTDRKPDKPNRLALRPLAPVVFEQLESLVEMGDKGIRSTQVHGNAKTTLVRLGLAEERAVDGVRRTFVTAAGIERRLEEKVRKKSAKVLVRRVG